MTLGNRIAQQRKEQSLSQEALGEALGVSRQSVYKWESDSALPEIDKLIALSKLFGVTIGWLLGVEEAPENTTNQETAAPPDSGSDPGELTETQLKMVEEIVDRYLAARQPVRRRWWPWVLAGLALIAGFLLLRSELRDGLWNMQVRYDNLQTRISGITQSVDSQIAGITSRVEEVLKNQNNLAAAYGTEIVSADLSANTVTLRAYATPKTYTQGMTAVFTADNGEDINEAPGESDGSQTFSAELTCALTDGIDISVVFVTGDIRETQLLDTYYGLYGNSLPDTEWPEGDLSMNWKTLDSDGNLSWSNTEDYAYIPNSSSVSAVNALIGQAEVRSTRVGLFRNQTLLGWLEPCDRPAIYAGGFNGSDFYRFPEISVTPEAEDIFRLCTIVVDEFGREFVYAGIPYVLDAERGELTMANSGEIGPDDPANWEY